MTLIHRRDSFRAEKIMQDRLFRNPKIEVVWDSVVEEVLGTAQPPGVTGLRLRNVKTGRDSELAVDGLFIAIGHEPVDRAVPRQAGVDREGYIVTAAGLDGDRAFPACSPPATCRTRSSARR